LRGIAAGVETNKYKLYAVIVHEGKNLSSGHYLSFIKIEHQWLLCSDNKVQTVSWAEVQSQQAYILLYSKCSNLWCLLMIIDSLSSYNPMIDRLFFVFRQDFQNFSKTRVALHWIALSFAYVLLQTKEPLT